MLAPTADRVKPRPPRAILTRPLAQPEASPMFTGIDHVAYRVRDLEASLRFYRDVLGFELLFIHDRDGAPWLHYFRVSDHTFLELFTGGEDPRDFDERSVGPMHLCLRTDDLDAALHRLAARGLPVDGEPNDGPLGNRNFWIEDPDGNNIEIVQQLPDNLIEQALARRQAPPTRA
jgi:lactoylglutathione lyase